MKCEEPYPSTSIDKSPFLNGANWMLGKPVEIKISKPLMYALNRNYPGKIKPLYEGAIPIMRDDLVEAIKKAGARNLQFFPAVLKDTRAKKEYKNYKAFNIIGLVECADMEKSEARPKKGKIDVDFDSLVIDEKKADASGLVIFRLAEAISAIVVHEKIKKAIEGKIEGMVFYNPREWAG